MFVTDNSVSSARKYFNERLDRLFSKSELKLMFSAFLMYRLGISRSDLLLSDSLKCSESDLLYFRSCVKRLQSNEPFQYVIGATEFYGLEIKCDTRALIPRPETEELVDWIAGETENGAIRILDLCTGGGCIALGLKSALPTATIRGLDFSKEALSLANENAESLQLDVEFFEGDVLTMNDFSEVHEYDVFVSNPPYIPVSNKKDMHSNVLDFEPEMALFVENNNPFIFYDKIILLAINHLKLEGKIYFEIHEKYAADIFDLLMNYDFVDIEIRQDMQGKDRMVRATKSIKR